MQDLSGLPEHCRVDYQPSREDRFGWMFPHLAHSYVSPTVLQSIGKAGGPMDNGGSSDRTSSVPVGMVIFGQFIDHDITLDTSSSFASVNHPSETANVRTPHRPWIWTRSTATVRKRSPIFTTKQLLSTMPNCSRVPMKLALMTGAKTTC
jgi:hypothetical protein